MALTDSMSDSLEDDFSYSARLHRFANLKPRLDDLAISFTEVALEIDQTEPPLIPTGDEVSADVFAHVEKRSVGKVEARFVA